MTAQWRLNEIHYFFLFHATAFIRRTVPVSVPGSDTSGQRRCVVVNIHSGVVVDGIRVLRLFLHTLILLAHK